jgi:hypothetical protein
MATENMTYLDVLNQFRKNQLDGEVSMGVRRLSYAAFKSKAREHQVRFRENILGVGFNKYDNVLNYADARKGLIFFEGFRDEIMQKLKEPVHPTSSAPSGQMLTNLLRSEHIPYNIFFPMLHDLDGAKTLFNNLLGLSIGKIEDIQIEYHPEPIERYLSDHTAFDVYIPYKDTSGQTCGIGIEVKYTENEYILKEGSTEYKHVKDDKGNTRLFEPYAWATKESGYYKESVSLDELVSNKYRQIWRNHILGASMVLRGDIAKFTSVTLYPLENIHFSLDAMPNYKKFLTDEKSNTCAPLCYEDLFSYMEKYLNVANKEEWILYLRRRYLFPYIAPLYKKRN